MTGRETILALLAGQEADRPARMPIRMRFAVDILGVDYGQYVHDRRVMVEA